MADDSLQPYVIWSEEHKAWWRPHAAGYTQSLKHAGLYSKERAASIVDSANMGGVLFNEVAFPMPERYGDLTGKRTHR